MVHHIENSDINKEVLKSNKSLVIVDFFATWCVPCQMLSPIMEEVSKENVDTVDVFKVNIDENQDAAMRYGITSVPTLVFFKDGKEVERQVGLMSNEELNGLIKQLL